MTHGDDPVRHTMLLVLILTPLGVVHPTTCKKHAFLTVAAVAAASAAANPAAIEFGCIVRGRKMRCVSGRPILVPTLLLRT